MKKIELVNALTDRRFLKNKILKILKKKLFGLTLVDFYKYEYLFKNKKVLEIGGKSGIFTKRDLFPIYGVSSNIDGLNFASNTLWEEQLKVEQTYVGTDRQYIGEANEMENFSEDSYDFVISSHCLEHLANPLIALSK